MPSVSVQPYAGSALIPAPDRASVADVMHPGILSCAPDASLREVAAIMATHRVHCVVVDGVEVDPVHGERLVWRVVDDLDVVRAVAAGEQGPVGRLAAGEPLTAAPREPLLDVARRMGEHDAAHVVVVSETSRRPIGVLSALDIARAAAWGG